MSSTTTFNDQVADKYGVNIAIIISTFVNFTKFNAAKKNEKDKNFHNGRYWVYGTPDFWRTYFTYFTARQIKYALSQCVKLGLLTTGNFNKHGYDRTQWYSLSDRMLLELNLDVTCSKPSNNHIGQNCPMDGTKSSRRYTPNNTPNKTTTSEQSSPPAPTSPAPTPLELVTVFAEELPDSPQPEVHVITKAVDQKTRRAITEFKKYWLARLKRQLTVDDFRDFLRKFKKNAPGFFEEYTNKGGKKQKNDMAVILYWENFEKYLSGKLF